MRPLLLAAVLLGALAAAAPAGDAITVLQETRAAPGPGRKAAVRHVAVLRNSASYPVYGLRVTVELADYFGAVLWARTAVPSPSSLRPGDTATLALDTPQLDRHRHTRYRFEYRTAQSPAPRSR